MISVTNDCRPWLLTLSAPTASDNPAAPQSILGLPNYFLSVAIYLELAPTASLDTDELREINLNVQAISEMEGEIYTEAPNESQMLLFIAVDHAKPARFESAVVKAEPLFDRTGGPGNSAAIRSNCRGFEFTLSIDDLCDDVTTSFVYAEPEFGILEPVGQLFVGVRLGELQAFAALTVCGTGTPNHHLPMENSAGGNGIMLQLVHSETGERMYSRFVLLPRKFMTALWRAIARQLAAPSQMPLELQ